MIEIKKGIESIVIYYFQRKEDDCVVFNTGAALLDAIVLAIVSKDSQGTYGYKITQNVKQAISISESTLYPVLRRLEKDGCLTVYNQEFNGRNRKYYCLTQAGMAQLHLYRQEWKNYSNKINHILSEFEPLTKEHDER